MIFTNRRDAGHQLADRLAMLQEQQLLSPSTTVVVALPRGGVPVGFEVAQRLGLPLDICVVRKVGAPWQPELALGAVAEGGETVVNERILPMFNLSRADVESLAQDKYGEVEERVQRFRGSAPPVAVRGKTVILVDDGVATGATALSAIHVLRKMGAAQLILALPVCPPETLTLFQAEADRVEVLSTPAGFQSVGQYYQNFDQTEDQEVQQLLHQAHADFTSRQTDGNEH